MSSRQWGSPGGSSSVSDRTTDSWSSSDSSSSYHSSDDCYQNDYEHHHHHGVITTDRRPPKSAVAPQHHRRGVDDSRNSWSSNEPRLQFATDVPSENVVYDMLLAAEAARMVDVERRKVLREEARMVASSHHLTPRERDMIVFRLRKRLHGGSSPLDNENDDEYVRGGTALSYVVHHLSPKGAAHSSSSVSSPSTISDTTTSSASPPMASPEALDRYVARRRARRHHRNEDDQVSSSYTEERRQLLLNGPEDDTRRQYNSTGASTIGVARKARHANPHEIVSNVSDRDRVSRSTSLQNAPDVKVVTYATPFSPFGSTVTRVGNDPQAVRRHLEGQQVEVALVPVLRDSTVSTHTRPHHNEHRTAQPLTMNHMVPQTKQEQLDPPLQSQPYRGQQQQHGGRGSSPLVVEFSEEVEEMRQSVTSADHPHLDQSIVSRADTSTTSQPALVHSSVSTTKAATSTTNANAVAAVEVVQSRLYETRSTSGDYVEGYDKRFSRNDFAIVDTLAIVPPSTVTEVKHKISEQQRTTRSTPLPSRSVSTASTSAPPVEPPPPPPEAPRAALYREQSVDAAVHVVTTVVAEVGCQHDPHFGASTKSTETSTIATKSRGIDTDEHRHVSVGVNVSSPRTSAQGTSTAATGSSLAHEDSVLQAAAAAAQRAALSARDVSPTPERTPPPMPTPHDLHRGGSTAYAFMSPIPFKGLRGFPHGHHHERREFRGPITPLGRKTPPRERNHVNSPPHQRGISPAATTTSRGSVSRPADEAHDRRIALKCVKHAVFGDFSRSLDFREKTGMTLKEARGWYDAMCEGDCEWGSTGVYRQYPQQHPSDDVVVNPCSRLDMLVQAAMAEVVRGGGCMEWSTWFAGISRRRVEEALERFSDVFAQKAKQYQWNTSTTTYVVDSSSGGLLMRVPASRVDAVASVLY